MEYTDAVEVPSIWRQWAGIATIAACLERKVWVSTTKGNIYPNFYTLLVGHPGTGKSVVVSIAETFLRDVTGLHIAPTSMTMAALVDTLFEAKCSLVRPNKIPPLVEYNALAILADELSALVHQYDLELMAGLTKMWDGGVYAQHRRGKDLRIKIDNPILNLLAGTTPSNLCKFMPEGAWDQGFASRIIMVYSGDRSLADIFTSGTSGSTQEGAFANLLHDLQLIYGLYGRFELDTDCVEAFREWRAAGEPPQPTHPKLTHYASRRTAHVLKLSMVASVSRGADLRVTLDDFQLARNWLLGAELAMPDIFTAGITGGDTHAMDEAWHFVWTQFAKSKRPVPEHVLVHFIRERVPSHAVMKVLDIMERDGSLKSSYDVRLQGKVYEPAAKKPGLEG